ncbi:transcriptional enhancer factor TEF-1-like isoform X2 [Tachypleus tridentatus]|uniref:transcriptional enhancer factor TEF-1-like isoform X2 n=1 Tax=Tachypleus tridentatus TaxID=6853 RepID=UPI003FD34416
MRSDMRPYIFPHGYQAPSVRRVPFPAATISSHWNSAPPLSGPNSTPSSDGTAAPPPLDLHGSDDSNSKDSSSMGKGEIGANDSEGVWSPDIEQSFQEALAIYPPCGRRKIILSDEGKMYGRNELIARYIKLRTGKTRTRKQVSSHMQVLARRKSREIQTKLKFWQTNLGQPVSTEDVKPFVSQPYGMALKPPTSATIGGVNILSPIASPSWEGRSIATHKLRLVEFSAFMEQQQDNDTYERHLFVDIRGLPSYSDPVLEAVDIRQIYDKFPEKKGGLKELYDKGPQNAFFLVKFWADLNTNIQDEAGSFYGVTSQFESTENMTITSSTKVCSFGKQVVEKMETEYARFENGRFVFRIHRSPMCEYMINFIHKLKNLPEKYMMNSVLENFTILQVVTNRETQETLLCIAYVFEVSTSDHGAQHHIYRLVKD